MDKIMLTLVETLRKNLFEAEAVENIEEARKRLFDIIPEEVSVSFGGSTTLQDMGVFDDLRKGNYQFIDWGIPDAEQKDKLRKQSLTADYYVTSSNAITMNGELVNIDGRGNRVAVLCYGPSKVMVVVGKNKIVDNVEAGLKRIGEVAAPLNAKRLNKKTPCVTTGKCQDCSSPERICNITVIHTKQNCNPGRIHVIMVNEDLGY